MALTKNKNLRALKQKAENLILVSQGVRNPNAYIERQLYGFRFMNMSLDTLDNLSVQAMILCFLVGGFAAFGSYWYRCDSYYIVLYGTMGILSGLFLVFVDNGTNVAGKRQCLVDSLVDYVENSPHFYRTVDHHRTIEKSAENVRRDHGARNEKPVEIQGKEGSERNLDRKSVLRGERRHHRLSVLSRKHEAQDPEACRGKEFQQEKAESQTAASRMESSRMASSRMASYNEAELARSIDYLKQSLEQIAAGREQGKYETCETDRKENPAGEKLKPEDLKVLGELLQEYFT